MAGKIQRKKGMKITREKLLTVAWFLIKFNLLAIPMYILISTNFSYQPLQNFLATVTYNTLKLMGFDVLHEGSWIITHEYRIDISWDSTGWKSLYALTALTIATPRSNLKGKAKFLAASLPLLFFINFLRILTTISFSLKYGFQYFEVIHTFLWREGLIFAVIAIWYIWLRNKI